MQQANLSQRVYLTLSMAAIVAVFFYPEYTRAQSECGEFILIESGFFGDEETREPVTDCDDPFQQVDGERITDVVFINEGEALAAGQTITVDELPTSLSLAVTFTDTGSFPGVFETKKLFLHEGSDYRQIGDGFSLPSINATGTYTLVHEVAENPVLSWQEKLRQLLIQTAHAQFGGFGVIERTAITFTVALPEPEPTGASSVLFLPGIQASRLYTREDDGSETLLWEPDFLFDDDDVLRLAMTEAGESVASVYVSDVIDFAPEDSRALENAVYGRFLEYLDSLVSTDTINEYTAFAYDWRYDVFDIVQDGVQYRDGRRYLTNTVEQLASSSDTGQVAIIAHSNGGLLAKALIDELEEQGKTNLIDSLIMIGTPQLGTPKAIGSLLHGTDQGIRVLNDLLPVITDEAVREAARNMPGAYGLLPGQAYFESAGDVVVLFDTGNSTAVWREEYGNALQSQAELDSFLISSANGRDNVPYSNLDRAIVANEAILNQARSNREHLDAWTPPAGINVTSITGTGLETISGFEYRSFTEQFCERSVCVPIQFYRPAPIQSFRGDQTVMSVSAKGGEVLGQTRLFVDLNAIDDELDEIIIHKNLTESGVIQELVSAQLLGTTTESQFVSDTELTFPDQQLFTYGANSPVYLRVTDANGRQTGQIDAETVVEDIPGSRWFTVAGVSYVSIPVDVEHTVTIEAFAEGSVTLTVDQLADDVQTAVHVTPIPKISSTTIITVPVQNESFTDVRVDLDGDGGIDEVRTLDGALVAEERTYSYDDLLTVVTNIDNRIAKRLLTRIVKKAAWYDEQSGQRPWYMRREQRLLRFTTRLTNRFVRWGKIDKETGEEIKTIVAYLRAN